MLLIPFIHPLSTRPTKTNSLNLSLSPTLLSHIICRVYDHLFRPVVHTPLPCTNTVSPRRSLPWRSNTPSSATILRTRSFPPIGCNFPLPRQDMLPLMEEEERNAVIVEGSQITHSIGQSHHPGEKYLGSFLVVNSTITRTVRTFVFSCFLFLISFRFLPIVYSSVFNLPDGFVVFSTTFAFKISLMNTFGVAQRAGLFPSRSV